MLGGDELRLHGVTNPMIRYVDVFRTVGNFVRGIDHLQCGRAVDAERCRWRAIEREKAELAQKDGSAHAQLQAQYDWGARVIPKLQVPLTTRLVSKHLRLASFGILMPGTINELDGRLDADITGQFGGGEPFLQGQAVLKDGVLQEPTVGQRFSDTIREHLRYR